MRKGAFSLLSSFPLPSRPPSPPHQQVVGSAWGQNKELTPWQGTLACWNGQ